MRRISEPADSPVSLDDAKLYLRVDHDEDDDLIQSLIDSATTYVEEYTHRALVTQTWEITLDEFPTEDYIRFPRPPLVDVTDFVYTDSDDTDHDFTDYILDLHNNLLNLAYEASWPTVTLQPKAGIVIQFECGYSDYDSPEGSEVPTPILTAIKQLVAHWYEHREITEPGMSGQTQPLAVTSILNMYRWPL